MFQRKDRAALSRAVLPPSLPSKTPPRNPRCPLGRPESCPAAWGPACARGGMGHTLSRGTRSPRDFLLSLSPGQRSGKKSPPSPPPPTTPSSPGDHQDQNGARRRCRQNNQPRLGGGFKWEGDGLRAGRGGAWREICGVLNIKEWVNRS